jgi:hypothetical protein
VTELQVRVCVMVFEKEINGNNGCEKRNYYLDGAPDLNES